MKAHFLNQKFWMHFAKNIWEKKTLEIKNVKSPLFEIGKPEIFRMLVDFSDRCRKLKDASGFKFYINGIQAHPDDVMQILPIEKDQSLLGYHQRMNALFADYCLVCDELLKTKSNKTHLLSDFTDELYRHTGFPNRFSEMGLYLGNYRKTPFGVHVDRCGVFSFPVVGQKKFRIWTSEFVKKNPKLDRTFNYQKYKKDSQVLTAKPGDITYWPSSAWHIAESDGSFSATWSLGVWVDKPHQKVFSESLEVLFSEKLGTRGASSSTAFIKLSEESGEVKVLPAVYLKSIHDLQTLTSLELEEHFLKFWMQHISLQGFKNNSQTNELLKLKSHISLRNKKAKIYWQNSRIKKNKVFFSFGGILVESKTSSGLLKLVKSINASKTCLVRDFIKSQKSEDFISLQKLSNSGAFT